MALPRGLVEKRSLALHRLKWKGVEGANPLHLQEGTHEQEVAGKDDGLLLVLDVDRLVARGVAASDPHTDTRGDLQIAVDDLQTPFLLEQAEILRFVRRLAARIWLAPGLQLSSLDDVARAREERRQLAIASGRDQGPHVVEVQVAEHHQVDVLRREPGAGQRVRKTRITLVRIDVAFLFRELWSDASLDQDVGVRGPHQQAVGGHQDAVARVRGLQLFPHDFWNHAKNRTAVHAPVSIAQTVELEPPQLARSGRDHATLKPALTKSMMDLREVPGPKISTTPIFFSSLASSCGMMPPPKTTISVALRSLSSSSIRGMSVMWAPLCRLTPMASTSSWMAASTTISGVCRSPA